MGDLLADIYPWVKSLHIISVIAWMAGMFYLPRLYVYHADAEIGSDKSETFKIMERRLLRGIINPAMILTLVFGGLLLIVAITVDLAGTDRPAPDVELGLGGAANVDAGVGIFDRVGDFFAVLVEHVAAVG